MKKKKNKNPMDNVTTTNLHRMFKMTGMETNVKTVDKIIDLVQLLSKKGDRVSLLDISKLEAEWKEFYNEDRP